MCLLLHLCFNNKTYTHVSEPKMNMYFHNFSFRFTILFNGRTSFTSKRKLLFSPCERITFT